MSKPHGAMGANAAMPQTSSDQNQFRGNPPRYTHLSHSEAWAKIDAEEAALAEARNKQTMAQVREEAKMASGKPFEMSEMTKVMEALGKADVDIVSADKMGIVLSMGDLQVVVKKH